MQREQPPACARIPGDAGAAHELVELARDARRSRRPGGPNRHGPTCLGIGITEAARWAPAATARLVVDPDPIGPQVVGRMAGRAPPALRLVALGPPAGVVAAAAPRAGQRRVRVRRARVLLQAECVGGYSPAVLAQARSPPWWPPDTTTIGQDPGRLPSILRETGHPVWDQPRIPVS
jgi:hypothetical protein